MDPFTDSRCRDTFLHRVVKRLCLLCAVILTAAACDSSSDPTFPEVEGLYTGRITISFVFNSEVVILSGPASIEVAQSQSEVTLSGHFAIDSLILGDLDDSIPIPIDIDGNRETLPPVKGTIDKAGIFAPLAFGLWDTEQIGASCGTVTVTADIHFAEQRFMWEETVELESCPDTVVRATLTRGG